MTNEGTFLTLAPRRIAAAALHSSKASRKTCERAGETARRAADEIGDPVDKVGHAVRADGKVCAVRQVLIVPEALPVKNYVWASHRPHLFSLFKMFG